jgi:predicted nucleic acid-binding protein
VSFPSLAVPFWRDWIFTKSAATKEYSLTDCISMKAMRSESVSDVLTNDHHFEQEGFNILMKK